MNPSERVELFFEPGIEKLQSKINEFIRNLVWCDIVDIKYDTWRDTDESYMATAMVIYKARPLLKKDERSEGR